MSNIFVDDKGEGFPFVLVHGYLGSSEMWCFQKDYFSKDFRVIAPAPVTVKVLISDLPEAE